MNNRNARPAANQRTPRPSRRATPAPTRLARQRLRFTPYAWAKLTYLRDLGDTEIGGFGIAASNDPLLIEDVRLVAQHADWAAVAFDDAAVAALFDELVDAGRRPAEFARVWIHTHPGASAAPSATDEATFARAFGRCDWAVMAILARGGATSARLRLTAGPGLAANLSIAVEFGVEFPPSNQAAWLAEYRACVAATASLADGEFAEPAATDADPWRAYDEWRWTPLLAEEQPHGRHDE